MIYNIMNRKFRRNIFILVVVVFIVIVLQLVFGVNFKIILPGGGNKWIPGYKYNIGGDYTKLLKLSKKENNGCVHPQYQLWSPDYIKNADTLTTAIRASLNCTNRQVPVTIDVNGTFRYHSMYTLMCIGRGVIRAPSDHEDKIVYSKSFTIVDGAKSEYDYVMANCGKQVFYLIGIARKKDVIKRKIPLNHNKEKAMDIIIVGYDSTSQLSMLRNLPGSVDYFENTMGAIRLKEYNILGDGTPAALLPILTGKSEQELPEARHSKADKVKNMDDFPFIWKTLRDKGYATQWGEDSYRYGTFTYRLVGFKEQPVDHYMRNFYIMADYEKCIGKRNTAENMLNHVDQFMTAYNNRPKFSFMFHAVYTHDRMAVLNVVDKPLKKQLKEWNENGRLNNTLLILMSDHGNRYTDFRNTLQGKIEERTPYFALRYPDWFVERYPTAVKSLRHNTNVLTTPYDIHETLLDTLDYRDQHEFRGPQQLGKRHSLLQPIHQSRDCSTAGIEAHWCGCLDWKHIDKNSTEISQAADFAIGFINAFNQKEVYNKCRTLFVNKITDVVSYSPNSGLLKFVKTSDADGRVASLDEKIKSGTNIIMYQLTIVTTPNNGIYEITISKDKDTKKYNTHESQISRINKYGNQPNCIAKQYAHMRAFCYCKSNAI